MSLFAAAGRALKSIGHGLQQLPSTLERDRFRIWYGDDWEKLAAERASATQYLMRKQAAEEESRDLENQNRQQIIQERTLTMRQNALKAQDTALDRYRDAGTVLAGAGELPPGEPGPPAPPDMSGLDTSGLPAWAQAHPAALQNDIMRTRAVARDKEGTAQANAERQATLPLEQLQFQRQVHTDLQAERAYQHSHKNTPAEHKTPDEIEADAAWAEAERQELKAVTFRTPDPDALNKAVASRAAKILSARRLFRKNQGIPVRGGLRGPVPQGTGIQQEPDNGSGEIDLSDIADGLTVSKR